MLPPNSIQEKRDEEVLESIDWQSRLLNSRVFPVDAISSLFTDDISLVEHLLNIINTSLLPIEWNSELIWVISDALLEIDWIKQIIGSKALSVDHIKQSVNETINEIDWNSRLIRNGVLPIDAVASFFKDDTFLAEHLLRLNNNIVSPISWDTVISIALDALLQVDWIKQVINTKGLSVDHVKNMITEEINSIDWLRQTIGNVANDVDWLGVLKSDKVLPIDWGSTVVEIMKDVLLQINWDRQIIKDAPDVIEWVKSLSNTSNVIPIEALNYIIKSSIGLTEYSKTTISSLVIRIESIRNVTLNKTLPIEFGLYVITTSLYNDIIIPIEWGSTLEPIQLIAVTTKALYGIGVNTKNKYEISVDTKQNFDIDVNTKRSMRRKT